MDECDPYCEIKNLNPTSNVDTVSTKLEVKTIIIGKDVWVVYMLLY